MEQYQVGNGTQQVKLAVDVTTTGMAATRAFALTDNSSTSLAASTDATGDIQQTTIGTAASLQNHVLSVITKINITGSDATARKAEFDGITAIYVLDYGQQGHAVYNLNKADKVNVNGDYTEVELYERINLY